MPRHNTQFDLTIRDMELIEAALQSHKKELSLERLNLLAADDDVSALDAALVDLHDLMGRLHNQKVFYRPNDAEIPYVSG